MKRKIWIRLLSLAALGAQVGFIPTSAAQENNCGNASVAPRIYSGKFVAPDTPDFVPERNWNPANGRLERSDVQYVSFNSVRMEIVTDACTAVREVRLGNRILAQSVVNAGGYWFTTSPSVRQPTDPSQRSHSITVFFLNPADGTTERLIVNFVRVGGAGAAAYSARLAHVLAVERNQTKTAVSISAAEFHNMLAAGLHKKFGPENKLKEGRITISYDPASLSTAITAGGLSFGYKLRTDIPCSPTLQVSGRFVFEARPRDGITVVWKNNGPRASAVFTPQCSLPVTLTGPLSAAIDRLIRYLIDGEIETVKSSMNEQIAASIRNSGGNVNDFQSFLGGSTAKAGEVLVHVNLIAPSATISVPYFAVSEGKPGIGVPRRERVLLTATGLGMNDVAFGVYPATTLSSGPNGVPPSGSVTYPNARVVARALPGPVPNARVGQLLVRPVLTGAGQTAAAPMSQPKTFRYSPGCSVSALAGPTVSFGAIRDPEIRLGVNDSPQDAARLRALGARGYKVRLFFMTGLRGSESLPPCGLASTSAAPTMQP